MTKQTSKKIFEEVLRIIQSSPNGISLEQILNSLTTPLPMRDVFMWAYERSSSLYSATRQELGAPDPFRLKYRSLIKTTVEEIVHGSFNKQTAVGIAKQKAFENVDQNDQARFVEVIETELMSLHKGNIARFRLKPSEYDTWQKTWH